MNKTVYLKIKLKSLAAESQIIRQQELKTNARIPEYAMLRDALAQHRRKDVRNEARATHLAYGYLRGRAYKQIEPSTTTPAYQMSKIIGRAATMVGKYGDAMDGGAAFKKWIEAEQSTAQPTAVAAQELAMV